MSELKDPLPVSQSARETADTLTFEERWAQWEEKGARHDARVERNMRRIAAIAVTIGVFWASVSLR